MGLHTLHRHSESFNSDVSIKNEKTIIIPDKTLEFLSYLVRQDATVPPLLIDYLKWNRYTITEITKHFHILNDACIACRDNV